jgi:flagellar hook-associated protein 1 FlgK
LLEVSGGALATLGLPANLTLQGSDDAVKVTVSGRYGGVENQRFRFVPMADGQIGVTKGLQVAVFDANDRQVATLNVGQGYSPGDTLEVKDGIQVSFSAGTLTTSAGHQFALDAIADGDTSDVLVALGLNAFFTGSSAADIAVAAELKNDASLLAAGHSGGAGDAGTLERLLGMRQLGIGALDEQTLEDFQQSLIAEVGFDTAKKTELLRSEQSLLDDLRTQRDQIAGVSLDEELVEMARFQRAFDAASRYIAILDEMTQTILDLAR